MVILLEDYKVSDHFTADEYANHVDGKAYFIPCRRLQDKNELLRLIVGRIDVTSGTRIKSFNASLPGAYPDSYHLTGEASDLEFDFSIWTVTTLQAIFKGIGYSNSTIYVNSRSGEILYVHVDVGAPRQPGGQHVVVRK